MHLNFLYFSITFDGIRGMTDEIIIRIIILATITRTTNNAVLLLFCQHSHMFWFILDLIASFWGFPIVISLTTNSGIEIWRIENFRPVPVPKSSSGKFFTGDSYVILKVSNLILEVFVLFCN